MNSTIIMRSDDLRVQNRHRVIETLRKQGSLSRAEIGRQTGLSQAALSSLFGSMTEQGIVTSVSQSTEVQKRGRPKTTIALNPSAAMVVTVALTIDQISFCLVNYAGETLTKKTAQIDTRLLSIKTLLRTVVDGIKAAIKPKGLDSLRAISIGFQGVTDSESGELLWSPILSMDQVPIAALLKEKFSVPVSVHNDCALIAKALHSREKDRLGESFAAVLFSHGIGMGVYLAGQPFTGAHSSALEIGHVQFEKDGALCRCGKRGCIEAYAANYGILREAAGLSPDQLPAGSIDDQNIDNLIDAANQNGTSEKAAFELAGKAIGFGLATVFTLLDPIPVALVGHNSNAVDLMREQIEIALKAVGHGPADYSHLLYCFHEDTPLLLEGLVLEAMSSVDRVFAEYADELVAEVSLS